jgi:hypothetical protein
VTTPIFPALSGQDVTVHRKPTFSTQIASHVSGREIRNPLYQNPVWNFEAKFNSLESSGGVYGAVGAYTKQALENLFVACQGRYGTFLYYDPTDYSVTNQWFAIGDGSTKAFQLLYPRGMGGVEGNLGEWVTQPVLSATTLYFPGGQSSAVAALVVKINGTTTSAYTISNGLITFSSPPAASAALTWTGAFGFLCRFDDDTLDFEQIFPGLWICDSVKFRSVRAQ